MYFVHPVHGKSSNRFQLDSGFRLNDGHYLYIVIPAKAGIQKS